MDLLRESLNNICRLCLTKVDDPSTMQTLVDEKSDTVWSASVRSFTLKKPMANDKLPNKMCTYCAEWITKLIHFKLQCQVSERLLNSLLKHYKGEIEKTTAVVTVSEQQWNVPVHNTRELLSKYENHLNRLHKAVQFTVTHLDKCAGEGHPILPYKTVNTVQFYLTFIQHLILSANSISPADSEDILRAMPLMTKEQTWEAMPVWAQEILNNSYGQLWDRFIQATCCPNPVQTGHSGQQPSSQYPVLQAVLCHSGVKSTASSETPTVIQLNHNVPLSKNSNMSKPVQPKQTDLSAALTSQSQKSAISRPQGSSKPGGESIHSLQTSAGTQQMLNGVSEVCSSNIVAQRQVSSKPSLNSVQLTSPAQNMQEVRDKTAKPQSAVPFMSIIQSSEMLSEVQELLTPTLDQDNLQDQTLHSSVINDLIECTQAAQKSVDQPTGLRGQDSLAEPAKKTQESIQGSQRTLELKGRLENTLERLKNEAKKRAESQKSVSERTIEVMNKNSEKQESQSALKQTSGSGESAKKALGLQEVNRVREQTNKTGSKEVTSQGTNLQKQPNKIQESQGQMNKTNESCTVSDMQMSANQAVEANTSLQPEAASSSGQGAAKSTEEPRPQTKDKQKLFELILHKAISRAYEREKIVPSILKRRKRVRSHEDPISPGLERHIISRIKNETTNSTVDNVSRPASAPNAGVFDVLPPLIPIPRSNTPSTASNLSFMSKLKERSINHVNNKEVPSSVSKSTDNGTIVLSSSSHSSQQPSTTNSTALTVQGNSEKSSENSTERGSSPATLKRNEENNKSGEEATTAKAPAVPRGIIRVRQDLATDPAIRNSSHNSKQPQPQLQLQMQPKPSSFTVQQQNQVNVTQSFPVNLQTVRVPVSGSTPFTAIAPQPTGMPAVQHGQHQQHWMLKQPPPYQPGIVPTSTTNVSRALPVGVITTVFSNPPSYSPSQTSFRFPISALGGGGIAMSNLYQKHLGITVPESEHFKEPWISQLVLQLQSLQNGSQSFGCPPQKNTAEQHKTASHSVPVIQQYNGTVRVSEPSGQAPMRLPWFPLASMNRMAALQQHQANSRGVGMPAVSQLGHSVQRFQHNPLTVPVSQQLNVPKVNTVYAQQPSVVASVIKNPALPQVSQQDNNPLLRQHLAQAGTSTSKSQQPCSTISVPQYQKAQTEVRTLSMGPRMSAAIAQSQSIQTSASQTNVPGQHQQAKPAATAVSQCTNTALQVLSAQSSQSPPVAHKVRAKICVPIIPPPNSINFTNPAIPAKPPAVLKPMMLQNQSNTLTSSRMPCSDLLKACANVTRTSTISVPKVYKLATATVPGTVTCASDNQSNKQQFLNVSTQYNGGLLISKTQNISTVGSVPSTSVKSSVVNVQRPSQDGQIGKTQASVARSADQPGLSVLPEVVRAIGPELGVFMEEDGLESSLNRAPPWKSPIVIPEPPFMHTKQNNKTPAKRSPKGAAALAEHVKLNLMSLMQENSRETLDLSEERWQRLQAAILNPALLRKCNWKLIKPPGVKVRRYYKNKQQENKVVAVPVTEPTPNVPVENIRVGDVLQSEVATLSAVASSSGEADKPFDFRIKITKNNGKYESSPVDHGAIAQTDAVSSFDSDSSDSWEFYAPRAAKRRRVIYDADYDDYYDYNSDVKEIEKPSIKVWQLQPYQLAPYVSLTKLHPEFFQPDCLYDLKDLKVAAMAQRLSMVVRKPGTVGRSVKEEPSQSILPCT